MPITLPSTLPAFDVLRNEGVMVMSPDRAAHQDIRPLRIALLNLMPKKIQTENQFARLIGATPLQIDFQLIRMTEHLTKNTAAAHMETFYRPFAEVEASGEKFDGLIITGAPIEHLAFEDVTYWDELRRRHPDMLIDSCASGGRRNDLETLRRPATPNCAAKPLPWAENRRNAAWSHRARMPRGATGSEAPCRWEKRSDSARG